MIDRHEGFRTLLAQARLLAMLDDGEVSTRSADVQDQMDEATGFIASMIDSVSVTLMRTYAGQDRAQAESTNLRITFAGDPVWSLTSVITGAQRAVQSPADLPWLLDVEGEELVSVPSEWTQIVTHALEGWIYEALR